ncbi:hypothetical protein L7F22_026510 [Adiantum nelumboides]|nr:hypothetical protein [Adiantum nelumboides]
MANYSTPWTLPASFMPCDSSFKGNMVPLQSSGDSLLMNQSPHGDAGLPEEQGRDDGILYVTIHQAKHIHNICIYGNQDVYAKFLLTHCQDAVYPTRPVKAGGQNPVFNQSLEIPICGQDVFLKCELWMMSCERIYLEDQLLGFVLVPLKTLYGKGKQTCEYCLTSTDYFYTPAGTVQLSLSILDNSSVAVGGEFSPHESERLFGNAPSNFQEVMMECEQQIVTSASMCKVEFLDLEAAAEDQRLVSMYYKLANSARSEECNESSSSSAHSGNSESAIEHAGHGTLKDKLHAEYATPYEIKDALTVAPLVDIHASSVSSLDDEMVVIPREEEHMGIPSYLPALEASCEMEEMANADLEKELLHCAVVIQPPASGQLSIECTSEQTPESAVKEMVQETGKPSLTCQAHEVLTHTTPLVNTRVEPETTINQEHFVDLYLKSMQQFTDKLADMQFPFDINSKDLAALRSVQVDRKVDDGRKKEGSKLYYGSRAFY